MAYFITWPSFTSPLATVHLDLSCEMHRVFCHNYECFEHPANNLWWACPESVLPTYDQVGSEVICLKIGHIVLLIHGKYASEHTSFFTVICVKSSIDTGQFTSVYGGYNHVWKPWSVVFNTSLNCILEKHEHMLHEYFNVNKNVMAAASSEKQPETSTMWWHFPI